MRKLKLLTFTVALTMGLNNNLAQTYMDQLSSEQIRKLDEYKKLKEKQVNISNQGSKKNLYNPNLTVNRNDSRVMDVKMTVNDTIDTKICFGSPLRIFLADDREKVTTAGVSDNQIYFSAQTSADKRSVIVSVKKPIPSGKSWPGFVSIYRDTDGKAYHINLLATECPMTSKRGNYPQEIRIQPIDMVTKLSKPLLNPEHFITELTKATPRKNIHKIELGLMRAHSNYTKIHIPLSIKVEDDQKRDEWSFEFHFIDSLQIQKFKSRTELLKYSSIKRSRKNGQLTLEFNAIVDVTKKYIEEREHIYLLLVDRERGIHEQAKIPLKQQFEMLKNLGYELN